MSYLTHWVCFGLHLHCVGRLLNGWLSPRWGPGDQFCLRRAGCLLAPKPRYRHGCQPPRVGTRGQDIGIILVFITACDREDPLSDQRVERVEDRTAQPLRERAAKAIQRLSAGPAHSNHGGSSSEVGRPRSKLASNQGLLPGITYMTKRTGTPLTRTWGGPPARSAALACGRRPRAGCRRSHSRYRRR